MIHNIYLNSCYLSFFCCSFFFIIALIQSLFQLVAAANFFWL